MASQSAKPAPQEFSRETAAIKNKLAVADMARPKLLPVAPDYVKKIPFGVILGKVSETRVKEDNRDGSVYEQLVGNFEFVPFLGFDQGEHKIDFTQHGLVPIQSGVMYLPEGLQAQIASNLEALKKEDAKGILEFGFEVAAVRATNAHGYTWEFKPIMKPSVESDPMAHLRSLALDYVKPAASAIEDKSPVKGKEKATA